jgi:mono/diheme cytochrome c family protein
MIPLPVRRVAPPQSETRPDKALWQLQTGSGIEGTAVIMHRRGLILAAALVAASPALRAADEQATPPDERALPAAVVQGKALYARHCAQCHGADMVTPGTVAPDLRQFPRNAKDRFVEAVLYGKSNRMPPLGEVLSRSEIDALWSYVLSAGS